MRDLPDLNEDEQDEVEGGEPTHEPQFPMNPAIEFVNAQLLDHTMIEFMEGGSVRAYRHLRACQEIMDDQDITPINWVIKLKERKAGFADERMSPSVMVPSQILLSVTPELTEEESELLRSTKVRGIIINFDVLLNTDPFGAIEYINVLKAWGIFQDTESESLRSEITRLYARRVADAISQNGLTFAHNLYTHLLTHKYTFPELYLETVFLELVAVNVIEKYLSHEYGNREEPDFLYGSVELGTFIKGLKELSERQKKVHMRFIEGYFKQSRFLKSRI